MTALVSKPNRYGIKATIKISIMTIMKTSKAYVEMVTTFRQNHSKEEDD